MIRLKESTMCRYRPGFINDMWLKEALSFPDALGRTGHEAFEEHDIKIVSREEKADVGFAKGISKVKGVPRKRCVLWRGEPPIYDLYFGLCLRNKSYLDEHLGIMSYYKDEYDCVHISGPQNAFSYYKKYFLNDRKKFLCMILSNKSFGVFLNGIVLPETRKHSLMQYREHMDNKFCELLGTEKYESYGKGWNPKCFKGPLKVWADMHKTLGEHKFAFVPENSSYPGYVSDKIINAMCCGAIPIYAGAPDISEYIPRNTFIKSTSYKPEDLVKRMEATSFSEYQKYRNAIRKFVTSNQSDMYSSYCFAEKIANIIEENL